MATTPKPSILKAPLPSAGSKTAAAADATTASAPGGKSGGRMRWILIGIGVVLLIALAVGGWLWRRHASSHAKGAANHPVAAKPVKLTEPAVTVSMPMDPFVVNLADAGGHSYARIGLTLRLVAPPQSKGAESAGDDLKDMARDTIITVLSQQQSADLMAPGGKDHLKQILRQAMIDRDPRLQVVDIYFTEFLVQP